MFVTSFLFSKMKMQQCIQQLHVYIPCCKQVSDFRKLRTKLFGEHVFLFKLKPSMDLSLNSVIELFGLLGDFSDFHGPDNAIKNVNIDFVAQVLEFSKGWDGFQAKRAELHSARAWLVRFLE